MVVIQATAQMAVAIADARSMTNGACRARCAQNTTNRLYQTAHTPPLVKKLSRSIQPCPTHTWLRTMTSSNKILKSRQSINKTSKNNSSPAPTISYTYVAERYELIEQDRQVKTVLGLLSEVPGHSISVSSKGQRKLKRKPLQFVIPNPAKTITIQNGFVTSDIRLTSEVGSPAKVDPHISLDEEIKRFSSTVS
ncbi:unnamed protein product [Bursaphelenchus xylophilus]|uniref:(pine wood nematode) hypothetical protein n=1 Tax=Bursaphelenchus xylophilus TaxID=6326 RepID=A0A1I7RV09_BURXY|nr:unnamed protein product [Bursaphelenchus xylophilus]CAG9105228.1 unnamed protein product [Bursaphelenchus xylophilus]